MIVQLPQEVINQIAAGEVVERPASVVKELVENSLDAGATRIDVSILDGGREEIRIVDNGVGIDHNDLPKVFMPHATSKIRGIEDLFTLQTMGFRGEALASIASVSDVTVETRSKNDTTGYRLKVSGGKVDTVTQIVKPDIGTSITVRRLFYTVPVRKKFVKSQATEVSHITKIIENMALAHPEIQFSYASENRTLARYTAASTEDRVAQVFHLKSTDSLLDLSYLGTNLRVSGILGHPSISRKNTQGIRILSIKE